MRAGAEAGRTGVAWGLNDRAEGAPEAGPATLNAEPEFCLQALKQGAAFERGTRVLPPGFRVREGR